MLDELNKWYEVLPSLLKDESLWNSLFIDYETPHVSRLWRQVTPDLRLMLHEIYPCDKPYLHQHPWPSAVKVLSGNYKMQIGTIDSSGATTIAGAIIMCGGSEYEMLNYNGVHSVQPLDEPSLSVMLIGRPWDKILSPTHQDANELDEYKIKHLLIRFEDAMLKLNSKLN